MKAEWSLHKHQMNNPLENCTFYGILDTGYVSPQSWVEKYDALVKGGAGLIQLRAKGSSPQDYCSLTEEILEHRAKSAANHPPIVINDDIQLCLHYPDLGLHIEDSKLTETEARSQLGPDRILGIAVTTPERLETVEGFPPGTLSYFSIGPVFPSQTKPSLSPVGLEFVRYVVNRRPNLPYFCIGGINRKNIEQVAAAGAERIVSVADVLSDSNTSHAVAETISRVRAIPRPQKSI